MKEGQTPFNEEIDNLVDFIRKLRRNEALALDEANQLTVIAHYLRDYQSLRFRWESCNK